MWVPFWNYGWLIPVPPTIIREECDGDLHACTPRISYDIIIVWVEQDDFVIRA